MDNPVITMEKIMIKELSLLIWAQKIRLLKFFKSCKAYMVAWKFCQQRKKTRFLNILSFRNRLAYWVFAKNWFYIKIMNRILQNILQMSGKNIKYMVKWQYITRNIHKTGGYIDYSWRCYRRHYFHKWS